MSQSATHLSPPIPSWERSLTTQAPCKFPNGDSADYGCSMKSCTPDHWWTRIVTAIGLCKLPNNIPPSATGLGSSSFATLASSTDCPLGLGELPTGVPCHAVLDDNLTFVDRERLLSQMASKMGVLRGADITVIGGDAFLSLSWGADIV